MAQQGSCPRYCLCTKWLKDTSTFRVNRDYWTLTTWYHITDTETDVRTYKHTHNTHSFTAHVVHKYDHNNGFLRTFLLCIHQYTWFKYKNDEDSQKERSIFFFQDKNNHDTVNADIFSFCHFIYCELNNMALSSEESYLSFKTKKGNKSFETNLLNN